MNASDLIPAIRRGNPMHGRMVESAFDSLEPGERELLSRYVEFCGLHGYDLERLAAAYNKVVRDTFREEVFFQRHGRYRHSTYEQVASSVYLNPGYMRDYMHGLAVTGFLWPHHVLIRRFFDSLLAKASGGGGYLEVGPGHGLYLASAVRSRKWRKYCAVDVSPTSLEMTKSILGSGMFGELGDFELKECDFLEHEPGEPYDALVMGEVLEHVEDPGRFLRKIFEVTVDRPFVFLTTCINAPAVDHLSNFGSPAKLEAMFESAGFRVSERLVIPYFGKSVQESTDEQLSINVAYSLQK